MLSFRLCRGLISNLTLEDEKLFLSLVDNDNSGHIDLKEFEQFLRNDVRVGIGLTWPFTLVSEVRMTF